MILSHAEIVEALHFKCLLSSDEISINGFGGVRPIDWFESNSGRFTFTLGQISDARRSVDIDPPCGTGVYFLFSGDNLQYIGQSVGIHERLMCHLYPDSPSRIKADWFDHWTAIWVPQLFLKRVEYGYIEQFNPPRNIKRLRGYRD